LLYIDKNYHSKLLCHKRSDVQHHSSSASHIKDLHLGGAFVLLSSLATGTLHCPTKNALYADAAEYCWFAAHRQRNLSWASLSVKLWRRLMYCYSTGMSMIQELLWRASGDPAFLGRSPVHRCKQGGIFDVDGATVQPFIFPTWTEVEASNSVRTTISIGL
jgi:hypothetical protein